ncbi:hypothetical protein [Paenibacillus koleovorans]|uniref:hypothetical protein n=1 Tax=Paenibacillus koleovorans TaxID=121608 RepID=UPI000FDB4033|nr:hypothetical protein [Paenibacillus koleovorans]
MKALNTIRSGAFVLVAASLTLTACGAKEETPAQTSTSSPSTAATVTAQPNKYTQKLTLDWFISAPANTNLPDAAKDFVRKAIEEKFNVELKVAYMATGTDYTTKTNTLLASSPPDMWRDATADGGQKYALDGILADMTKFVTPQTMPNYFKYWTTADELKNYQVQGKFVRAPLPYSKSVYRSFYIRKDWLDKLGLKLPTNYTEYYNILKAFTTGDPDGNGKGDTYGFTTAGSGLNLGTEWPELLKNGIFSPAPIKNNTYQDLTASPEMQGALDDVLKVINDKLVDPDWYLNKPPQHIEKAIQGKVGVVMGTTKDFAFDNNQQGIQFRSKQVNPNANWVPFTMFPNQPITSEPAPGAPFLFAKTVADKNPERIERSVAILDWLASEEGYILTHFGEANKHYTRNGNAITLNLDAYSNDIGKNGDFLKVWSFFTGVVAQPEVYGLTVVDSRETDRDREITKFLDAIPKNKFVGTSLVAPEGFDLAGYRKRQNELFSKVIFEDKSAKNWPLYRDELMTKYKGKDLYDKYIADLKAAGILK